MHQQPLVILTYPGHFLLTANTINTYLKYHNPQDVIVIIDDVSPYAWPEYVQDCSAFYNTKVITTSVLSEASALRRSPWVRQQIVKMYLDKILPWDNWFFSDGDVQFNFAVSDAITPYSLTKGGLVQQQQNRYVRELLDIDCPGIFVDHPHNNTGDGTTLKQVCLSNPPFRFFNADTLRNLRHYVEELHKKNFLEIHQHIDLIDRHVYPNDPTYSISEWELLASFLQYIKGQDLNLKYYPSYPMNTVADNLLQDQPHYVNIFCGTDVELGRDWFDSRNIRCTDRIWIEVGKFLNRRNRS
jgi:hypothetical protein